MTDPIPELSADLETVTATSDAVESESSVWGSLREMGGLGLLRLLPGMIRSAITRGQPEPPGGEALRRPLDRDADHLPDVGLDSAVTAHDDLVWFDVADSAGREVEVAEDAAAEADVAESVPLVEELAAVLDLDADLTAASDTAGAVAEAAADVDEAGLS
jgi:hypothetical protein